MSTDKDRPLTARQERFVEEYLATGNGTEACRRAGYSQRSEGCLRVQATENLAKPNVKQAIEQKRAEMSEDSEERRANWISQLERLGKKASRDSDKLRAIEQLFKAEGWLAPEQKEITTYESGFLADLDLDEDEPLEKGPNDNLVFVDFSSENNDLQDED
jgi:phage terminase small subunit